MINLLILLPAASFCCVAIYLVNQPRAMEIRKTFIRAAILTGVYAILSLEILSPFHLVTRISLILVWCIPLLAFFAWNVVTHRNGSHIALPKIVFPHEWSGWLALSIIGLIIILTAIVAWVSPPMTWDSMSYHMSRIAHWAENRSVWHYITGIERQNSMSPGAEMLTLHGYILTGSDRFSTFTEWLAMLGSVMGASLIAKILGGRGYAQWLSALFVATLPMGIIQASSTITDYVVAFWLVCLAVELLTYRQSKNPASILYAILATGMAVLTKPTCVPYIAPFMLWLAILMIKSLKPSAIVKWGFIAIGLMVLVTGGYVSRNIITFGGLSNRDDFRNHVNQLLTPAGFFSNVLKNAALQAGTPSDYLNNELDLLIRKVHVKIGVDVMDPLTTGDGYFMIRKPMYSEDMVSNPYHALLAVFSFIILLTRIRKPGHDPLFYALCVIAGFIVYSGAYKWHLFNVRYHLSFFVLIAPVFGLTWGLFGKIKWGMAISMLLWIASIPVLLSIPSRPLIPIQNISVRPSILTQSRAELRFANCASCYPVFKTLVEQIESNHCSTVGIMLNGDSGEYLIWKLFMLPQEFLRIEWIVAGTPSERYEPDDFSPCAVICEGCGSEKLTIRGLKLISTENEFGLYLNPIGE
jgi:hypothetical protein